MRVLELVLHAYKCKERAQFDCCCTSDRVACMIMNAIVYTSEYTCVHVCWHSSIMVSDRRKSNSFKAKQMNVETSVIIARLTCLRSVCSSQLPRLALLLALQQPSQILSWLLRAWAV
jgi:hypothetical protein